MPLGSAATRRRAPPRIVSTRERRLRVPNPARRIRCSRDARRSRRRTLTIQSVTSPSSGRRRPPRRTPRRNTPPGWRRTSRACTGRLRRSGRGLRALQFQAGRLGDPANLQHAPLSSPPLHRLGDVAALSALGALHHRRQVVGPPSAAIPARSGGQRTADTAGVCRTTAVVSPPHRTDRSRTALGISSCSSITTTSCILQRCSRSRGV